MDSRSELQGSAKRVLITGIEGFTGLYVANALRSHGFEVVGLANAGRYPMPGVHAVDLLDRWALRAAIAEIRPDAVVHLAAISFVAHEDVDAIYRTNVVGTHNLLYCLDAERVQPNIVILASSANVYGEAKVEPIDEDAPLAPVNDYAVSKMAMEAMAKLWADRLPIAITRPFNYTGVGQDVQFLVPKIVDHYQRGEREIQLGNIDVVRDISDVRDIANFYRLLVERAPAGAALNLCSERGQSLADVIDTMSEIAGYRIEVRVNPAFVRNNEIKSLIGSARRMREAVGDFERTPLERTLEWMYFEAPQTN